MGFSLTLELDGSILEDDPGFVEGHYIAINGYTGRCFCVRRKHYLLLIFVLTLTAVFFWGCAADRKMSVAVQKGQETDLPKEIVGKDGADTCW